MSLTHMHDVLECRPANGCIPFLPAIYEYKASLIGSTPTAIATNSDLLARALFAEFEQIGADALTVGVDVYNIEAEAVGCRILYPPYGDSGVPGLDITHQPFKLGDDFTQAPIPDPLRSGRMPVFIEAARQVKSGLGDRVWLRGAVTSPFSLAVSLFGLEELFVACLEEPAAVHAALVYCSRIIKTYMLAFIDVGVDPVLFDSQASPDLLSPALYETFVLPHTKELVSLALASGARHVPLVIGGNTTSIARHLIETGANNLLCDFCADFAQWAEACRNAKRALRRNLSPRFLARAKPEEAYAAAKGEIDRGRVTPGFIMGTGVIPIGTPLENLRAIRSACQASLPAT